MTEMMAILSEEIATDQNLIWEFSIRWTIAIEATTQNSVALSRRPRRDQTKWLGRNTYTLKSSMDIF
jgi:hypothetical protein